MFLDTNYLKYSNNFAADYSFFNSSTPSPLNVQMNKLKIFELPQSLIEEQASFLKTLSSQNKALLSGYLPAVSASLRDIGNSRGFNPDFSNQILTHRYTATSCEIQSTYEYILLWIASVFSSGSNSCNTRFQTRGRKVVFLRIKRGLLKVEARCD